MMTCHSCSSGAVQEDSILQHSTKQAWQKASKRVFHNMVASHKADDSDGDQMRKLQLVPILKEKL